MTSLCGIYNEKYDGRAIDANEIVYLLEGEIQILKLQYIKSKEP